jgi:hypothetical protein
MAAGTTDNLRVVSRGFGLWKDKEKREGRRITFDALSEETGLAKMTLRRFLATDNSDVSGSPLASAAVIANYFDVGLGDLLTVERSAEGAGREAVAA